MTEPGLTIPADLLPSDGRFGCGPSRIRPEAVATRYGVSPRTGGEWIRAMLAQGVLRKVRSIIVGRWSAIDAWVEAGGNAPTRRGRRAL